MGEQRAALTPALSLAQGEGAIPISSSPARERDRVRGTCDAPHTFVNSVREP
jgi:hypothetical protein